ncbi:beta-galactosidase [Sphingomonas sp. SUN039]|uniref:beta-galactosidase n=1 Tax=Sphingomonas sp. SUN039 TaxID=2937787 RepID=UPI0021645584|nr:beta-galactosidase [Sphingomonas sp. SUN039]UVO55656.1 beta-galactosidase [Sphingomonas sp. SUN039]
MQLGVCYYPEQWPEDRWADDARRMVAMGLSHVRIGEFAWSRIEPADGQFDWGWLDRAVAVLHEAGLKIVMGTPTATPPRWLVAKMPDMVAVDADGRPRKFGSRRHYCFSHPGYRAEAARIVRAVAARYGTHPAVVAWQTDNEYGCHDTAISYSDAAASGFRRWLAVRHRNIGALNAAWGNVFWSMDYPGFDSIDPPNLTVTEPNPAHVLDWRRFSSDEVVSFNRAQADILRAASPGRDIVHNFMGFFTQFDHHAVSRDLDVATWDSYPLGFLEQFPYFTADEKLRYARTGHPDIAAFHHDLYRGCAKGGRWWVMEQQPGPVNWARYNPAPLPGMVRLWTLEALAHGAELVSYFRWRQAPFAQEQMHSGLLRPDSSDDVGAGEVATVAREIAALGATGAPPKSVALVFSYEASWVFETQPQGVDMRYIELAFALYSALRRLGLDVDIVAPDASLDGYAMVVVPSLPIADTGLVERLAAFDGLVLLGPRSGSKTRDFAIPDTLPPGPLRALIPLRVVRVESLRPGLEHKGDGFTVARWLEHVESDLVPEVKLDDGRGVVFAHGAVRYLAAWPDAALLDRLFTAMAGEAALPVVDLPPDVRLRRHSNLRFAFNFGPEAVDLSSIAGADCVLGTPLVPPASVTVWRD